MKVGYYCERNKFGYCKFKNSCRYRHIDEECKNEQCDKRHPKECNYYKSFGRCKFGNYCKYSHKTSDKRKDIFDLTEKYDNLASVVESLKKDIEDLKN